MGKHDIRRLEKDIQRKAAALRRSTGDALCDFGDGASAALDAASQAPALVRRATGRLIKTGRKSTEAVVKAVRARPMLYAGAGLLTTLAAVASVRLARRRSAV